ncbi:putative membrane protein [Streptomyces himastatinicus ATCC 53653]|uniref:Putative membrane protein n=1 Tax=Streptomyces himastatinicus ATCC 53653 TaxID=457427 RepID=D9WKD8_9ACTN|nr:zf-HC2 domain-containing protein [Streptomyces himastatinicus]EFL25672.1 putative membrane protein [Streptomyces himastatinicus ATCC 53653]
MMPTADDQQHTAVGAYALGVLDAADAARFEEHLIGCERCAAELDGLMGIPPLLADYATDADGLAVRDPATLTARPGPEMLDRLLDEVTVSRRTKNRRRLFLVAAAGLMIVGGPLAGAAVTSGSDDGGGGTNPPIAAANPAQVAFDQGKKYSSVDPGTKVDASVSLAQKGWGTAIALKLGNLKGPKSCDLIAIGKDGHEETVTTWAVPSAGYGIKDGDGSRWNKEPLYAQGGAAMNESDIARFEVRTLDGQRLAEVNI